MTEQETGLDIFLEGDGCWPDLPKDFDNLSHDMSIAVLDQGMKSGRPSVAIRINSQDGNIVIGQTSARLFVSVARMILAKYPDLFKD